MTLTLRLCASLCLAAFISASAFAHDSINGEARKNYLTRLQEMHAVLNGSSAPSARANSLYQIAVTLDEIRELFNQDIISHGVVKGLETSLLLNELNRSDKLETSTKTGLYLSHLQKYREAIRLDPRAPFIEHARFMLLKSHFYDSFSDNPLKPFSQSKEELAEMISLAEGLLKSRHPQVSGEEVRFILGIHYLQAMSQQTSGNEERQKKLKKLVQELHKDYPQSLKLLTLESLMQ